MAVPSPEGVTQLLKAWATESNKRSIDSFRLFIPNCTASLTGTWGASEGHTVHEAYERLIDLKHVAGKITRIFTR